MPATPPPAAASRSTNIPIATTPGRRTSASCRAASPSRRSSSATTATNSATRCCAPCEQSGAGTLVHPTLGSMQCVLLEFACADRRERGRVVELQFAFIVAGRRALSRDRDRDRSQNVTAAAAKLNIASASDLGSFAVERRQRRESRRSRPSSITPAIAIGVVGDATRDIQQRARARGLPRPLCDRKPLDAPARHRDRQGASGRRHDRAHAGQQHARRWSTRLASFL